MDRQKSLTKRVNDKARSIVKAGGVHVIEKNDKKYHLRMPSLSKPGSYHNVYLRWVRNTSGVAVLNASCAWVEPVTSSQTHCPGNGNGTVCWHVLAGIIKVLENGDKVAFFVSEEKAQYYSRFGSKPWAILGKNVWFVVLKVVDVD